MAREARRKGLKVAGPGGVIRKPIMEVEPIQRNVATKVERHLVSELRYEPMYARTLNTNAVAWIAKNLEPLAIGVITVNKRKDGELIVLDGRHRVAALRELKRDDEVVNCLVYQGLTVAEEAYLFAMLNKQIPVRGDQMFRAAVIAGDKRATAVNMLLVENGFHVGSGGKPNAVAAPRTLYHLYEEGALGMTLKIMGKAFSENDSFMPASLIRAVGGLLLKFPTLNEGDFVDDLAKRHPKEWMREFREAARFHSTSVQKAAITMLAEAYNKNRQKNRLPDPSTAKKKVSHFRERG